MSKRTVRGDGHYNHHVVVCPFVLYASSTTHFTMTDMYNKPKVFEGKLEPYAAGESRVEVRRHSAAVRACVSWWRSRSNALYYFVVGCVVCLFLKKRGRVKDPVAYLHSVEQRARERQISYETVKLLRQRVIHCYRKEGVNHYENCQQVAQDYYDIITHPQMGQLQPKSSSEEAE